MVTTWYERITKVESRVHLEVSISLAVLLNLLRKYGGDPSVLNMDALRELFTYRNFDHFVQVWAWKNKSLREYEDFTYIAEKTAADLMDQNIQYVEMLFSPSLFAGSGLEVQLITEAIRQGLPRGHP